MTQAFNLAQLANNLNTSGQLDATDGLSGIVPIVNGGTGISTTPTNGQLLIGNGTGYTRATLTAGTNITITNSAGGIVINAVASAPVYSAQQTFPAVNVNTSWNHGLGQVPQRFGAFAVITVETGGIPVGTVLAITSSDGDGARQTTIYANTSVVGFFGSNPIYRGFDSNNFTISASNANIYFWAEK